MTEETMTLNELKVTKNALTAQHAVFMRNAVAMTKQLGLVRFNILLRANESATLKFERALNELQGDEYVEEVN